MFINLHGIGTFQGSNKAAFKYCIGLSHDHEKRRISKSVQWIIGVDEFYTLRVQTIKKDNKDKEER
jgi:hypothetical protein